MTFRRRWLKYRCYIEKILATILWTCLSITFWMSSVSEPVHGAFLWTLTCNRWVRILLNEVLRSSLWHSSPHFRSKTKKSMAGGGGGLWKPIFSSTLPLWLRLQNREKSVVLELHRFMLTANRSPREFWPSSPQLCSLLSWQMPMGNQCWFTAFQLTTEMEMYCHGALCSVLSQHREPATPAQSWSLLACFSFPESLIGEP